VKLLLLGANGQVGRELQTALATLGDVIPASRDGRLENGDSCETADLAMPQSLRALLDRVQPDVIVNAAAYTAVDRAEDEEELAHVVNAQAVAVLGEWASRSGALVVHYSTDYVFDGQGNRPYAEGDTTDSLGAYGRTKLSGEIALRTTGASHFIFRTAWVYASHGKNFLLTMLRLGADRSELRVVGDQIGAPTSAGTIALATAGAITRWASEERGQRAALEGTYHLVSSGQTSWHGFASAIFSKAAAQEIIERSPVVLAISSAEFPTKAKRPAYSVLDNSQFQRVFGIILPPWEAGLDQVLSELRPGH
jgi:dTDP-4-dehydrorhamnose reductase